MTQRTRLDMREICVYELCNVMHSGVNANIRVNRPAQKVAAAKSIYCESDSLTDRRVAVTLSNEMPDLDDCKGHATRNAAIQGECDVWIDYIDTAAPDYCGRIHQPHVQSTGIASKRLYERQNQHRRKPDWSSRPDPERGPGYR